MAQLTHSFQAASKRKYIPIIIIMVIGFLVSGIAFKRARDFEAQKLADAFHLAAQEREQLLYQQIEFDFDSLTAIGGLYAASKSVERDEFHAFTESLFRKGGITSLAWLPRIAGAKKEAFEQQVQQEGIPDFRVVELSPEKTLVPVADRLEYFPIYFFESEQTKANLLGLDIWSNPANQRALETARSTGLLAITPRTQALEEVEDDDDFEASAVYPIYTNGLPHDTVETRRQNLVGYVLANVRFDDIFEAVFDQSNPSNMDMYLFDLSAPTGQQFLAAYHSHPSSTDGHDFANLLSIDLNPLEQGIYTLRTFEVGQRKWAILSKPTPEFIAEHETWQPWLILTGGILFTLLLAQYLLTAIRRNAQLTHEVAERQQIQQTLELYQQNLEEMVIARTQQLETQTQANQELLTRQQIIFDTVPVGIAEVKNNQFIWGNQGFAEIMGVKLQEVQTLTAQDLFTNQADYDRFRQEVFTRITAGQVYSGELLITHKQTQQPVWFSLKGQAIEVDNLAKGTIWAFEDISARKESRRQLQQLNEELAASNEELQSTSEELLTLTENLRLQIAKQQETEILLQQRSNEQEALLSTIPAIVFFKDRKSNFIAINQTFATMINLAQPDLVKGKNDFEFFPKEQAEAFRADDEEVMASGKPKLNIEEPAQGADGSTLWLSTSKSPVFDATGQVVGIVGMAMDITERKKSELALQQANLTLQAILESTTDNILAIDKEFCYLAFNSSFKETVRQILGIDPYIGQNGLAIIQNHADYEKTKIAFERVLAGERFVVEEMYGEEGLERLWFELAYNPIWNQGQIVGATIFTRNITDRKRAEWQLQQINEELATSNEELRVTEEQLLSLTQDLRLQIAKQQETEAQLQERTSQMEALLDSMPMIVFFKDKNSNFVTGSRTLLNLLRLESVEVLRTKTDYDFFPPEQAERLRREDALVMAGREAKLNIEIEQPVTDSTGKTTWVTTSKAPVFNALGEVIGVVGISMDITERKRAELALKQANVNLAAILESTHDSIFALDTQYCYTTFNTGAILDFRNTFGRDIEVGLNPLTIIEDEATREATKAAFDRALRGERFTIEQIYGNEGQTSSWFELSYNPIIRNETDILGMTVFVRNITERKQAEMQLHESEEKFRVILENAPEAIMLVDKTGIILLANEKTEQMFGYSREEIMGQPIELLVPMGARHHHTELVQRYFDKPHTRQMGHGLQLTGQRKDRTVFPIDAGLSSIQTKDGLLATVFVTDITQRRSMEEAIRRSETLLKNIINNTPTLIYVKAAADGRHLLVNRAYEEWFNLTSDQILGKSDYDLLPASLAETLRQSDLEIIQSNTVLNREELIPMQSGEVRTYISLKFPLHDEHGVVYALCGMSTDITERKKNEEALQQSEARQRALLNALPDLMFQLRRDGVFLDYRGAKDEIYVSNEAIVNRNIQEIMPLPFAQMVLGYVERALTETMMQTFEYQLPMPNGLQEYEARMVPATQNDVLTIIRNVTSRKQAERQLKTLYNISQGLNTANTAQELLDVVVQSAPGNAFAVILFYVQIDELGVPQTTEVVATYVKGDIMAAPVGTKFILNDFAFSKIWLDNPHAPTIIANTRTEPTLDEALRGLFLQLNILSVVNIPLNLNGRWVGLLSYTWPEPQVFGERDLEIYQAVMHVATAAVQNRRLIEDLQQEIIKRQEAQQRQATLYRMSQGLNLATDEQAILDVLIENTKGEGGFASTLFHFELDNDESPLWAVLVAGYASPGQPISPIGTRFYLPEFPFCEVWLANPNEPVLIENTALSELLDVNTRQLFNQLNIGRIANIPIRLNNRWIGVLTYQWQAPRIFTPEEVELYRTVMSLAAPAVDSRRLIHDLQAEIIKRNEAEIQMRHAKDQAEAANKAKSEFLANMSHELRTPLNGILGYAQILGRDKTLAPHQLNGVGIIQQSGEHLLTLINDILDLSKIEAGRIEIHPVEFHLGQFLNNIINVIRLRAEQTGLTFTYKPMADLPLAVTCDEKRLRQILINLLGNAIKFTKQGGVTFKVGPHYSKIRFQIEDTGVGIPEDQLELIFQPFRQVGDIYMKSEGTGLGLSISKRLVEALGGELKVTSTLGMGSTFWFDIDMPLAHYWQGADLTTKLSVIGYRHPHKSVIKVLVVDDKATNRSLAIDLLKPLGFEVYEAVDGQDGVEQAKAIQPDVVLMDIVMPVINGLEATRQIRQDPIHRDHEVIIIAASASAFENDYEASLQAGCNDFIPKPLHLESLLQKLEKLLGLEWVYEVQALAPAVVEEAVPQPQVEQVGPPVDVAQELLNFAQAGRVKPLREALDRLETLGIEYQSFVEKARQLVKQYKMKDIEALIKSYDKPS